MADASPAPSPKSPPSVESSWARIDAWLAEHAPLTHGLLGPPVPMEDIEAAQRRLGLVFHPDLVASLRCHDGTELQEGALELPGLYGPFARLADIVGNTLSLRSVADGLTGFPVDCPEEHEHTRDCGDEEDAYWRHEWLLITLGAGWDARDGLFLSCREGPRHGALGLHFNEDMPDFTSWPSLRHLLAGLAECLERRRPARGQVPVAFGGRLLWEDVTEPPCTPRSVLTLAGEAGEPEEPARVHTAEVPRTGPGGFGFFYFAQRITRPTPPDRPDAVFAEGLGPVELLRRMGVQEETLRERSRGQARRAASAPWGAFRPMVRAGACGTWSYAVDEAGPPQGHRAEVLRRLSLGTRAVALWQQDGEVRLSVYEDGGPQGPFGAPGTYETYGSYQAALGALHGTFGISFRPYDPELAALPSGLVLPLPADIPERSRHATVHRLDLGSAVERADEASLRAGVAAQLHRLAAETGIDSYPEVADALRCIDAGKSPPVTDDSPLGRRLRTLEAEAHAAQQSHRVHDRRDPGSPAPLVTVKEASAWAHRARAGHALRLFLHLPPHIAGAAVLAGRLSPDWRAEFLHDLGDHGRG
ncbi:MAG TPA: hypothetical protein VFY14_12830 [Streptomyces sp.]|nr:hypothetical protein [Streptomyces sp.]